MQGHMNTHVSWEALRGQDQGGKGKNEASNVPCGTAGQQSGIRHPLCEASSQKFNRSINYFVDDPRHRESHILTPGLPDCFQKN